jgi:hypothetical protein
MKDQTPNSSVKNRKSTIKSNRKSMIQEPSSPVAVFGGMGLRHSPVRNSIVMAEPIARNLMTEPIMIDDSIGHTPQRVNFPNIAERQRSTSSPPIKNSSAKRGDSLQTVQYENIRTSLEKNNQQAVQQFTRYQQETKF